MKTFLAILLASLLGTPPGFADEVQVTGKPDTGLQLADNPPMRFIATQPPEPAPVSEVFEIRDGFTLIKSLDEFRAAIKRDNQRIRLKPGVYRVEKADPPMTVPLRHTSSEPDSRTADNDQEHLLAVNGSNNHFDLRGVVFETPVSAQGKLSTQAHVADCWHINGQRNTFEGGYFRNVIDKPYPDYRVTECEFEVCNDHNTFLNCTFVIKGSIPYGYTDYYGKGGPNFGAQNKHSFMGIVNANDTTLVGCRVYQQSFGHCIHFHEVDGVRIEGCHFTGALRPTDDIFLEVAGRAHEYDFQAMYREKRPISRGEMIPLVEDGIRAYERVKNITVKDTIVERMRGGFQLLCTGDVHLEGVTIRESGDFALDVSAGDQGRVVVKDCSVDVAYRPVFNLTRGQPPVKATFDVTVLSPAAGVLPTPQASLGVICGDRCKFKLRDGTTRPLAAGSDHLVCGGKQPLTDSTVRNETSATLVLESNVRNCRIYSVGPVEDRGKNNRVIQK